MKENESIKLEFRLAKEYWLRVQPHIAGRRLRDIELFVAEDAHLRLRVAQRKVDNWNRTQEGRLSPLDVDLSGEKFGEPEALFADENLKPEILARIAAPLINKSEATLNPADAVHSAHELLIAAERYIASLPEQKQGIESIVSDMKLAVSHYVSFAEILRSNGREPRQIPLLPTSQQNRHGGELSLTALKKAVKDFFEKEKKNRPQITEEQYNRETEQNVKLAREGRLTVIGSGKPMTYQEWQSQPDEAIRECLQNNQILLQTLCMMRWERFKNHWQVQQRRAQNRKPSESKRPKISASKTKLPHSAASSPMAAGKRKQ